MGVLPLVVVDFAESSRYILGSVIERRFPTYHGKGIVRRATAEADPKSPLEGDLFFFDPLRLFSRLLHRRDCNGVPHSIGVLARPRNRKTIEPEPTRGCCRRPARACLVSGGGLRSVGIRHHKITSSARKKQSRQSPFRRALGDLSTRFRRGGNWTRVALHVTACGY